MEYFGESGATKIAPNVSREKTLPPASIEPGNQPPCAGAVGLIRGAELRAQKPLFRVYARDKRRDKERRQQHAGPRSKSESPAQRVDKQPQIAGVADDGIDAARDKRMPWLDGDQAAEPVAEHKDWPDPQGTTGGEENNAKPANALAVEGPEPYPFCVSGQIGGQKPDQREDWENPAVGSILALARAQVPAAKERGARHREEGNRKGNQGRVREEGG